MKRPRIRAGGFYFFRGYAAPAPGSTKPPCYAGYVMVHACNDQDALRSAGINSAVSLKSWPFELSVLRELFRLLRRSIFNCHQLPMADQVLPPPPDPAPVPAALPRAPAPENAVSRLIHQKRMWDQSKLRILTL